MRFVCEKCHTPMSYPDDKITKNKIRYTCKKCGHTGESSVTFKADAKNVAETSTPSNLNKWHATTLNTPRRSANDTAWYYSFEGTSHGPYAEDELVAMFKGELGEICENCHVWCRALDGWKPAIEVEPFASSILMPPPPPMPAPRKSDANLPPLFGGKSGARSLASNPRAARASSPDLASLKQRLKTETTLSHEAPTQQSMPALDSLINAESKLDLSIDESNEDPTKVGAVSPFFSFQTLNDANGEDDSAGIFPPDAIRKALENRPAPKTTNETTKDERRGVDDNAKPDADKRTNHQPNVPSGISSKPLPNILSASATSGINAFGASSNPTPGLASIFSSPQPASDNHANLKPIRITGTQSLETANKSHSSLPRFAGLKRIADTAASKSSEALAPALASFAAHNADAPVKDNTQTANSQTNDAKSSEDRELFNDFKEDFGDLLAKGTPPHLKDGSPKPQNDESMSDWLSSKTNLPSIADRSDSEISLAAISLDDNRSESESEQMERIDEALNSDWHNADADEASLPHIDLEDSVLPRANAEKTDGAHKSIDKSEDIPDIALDNSCDKSAVDSAVLDLPDIALDNSCDKSAVNSAVLDLPDTADNLANAEKNYEKQTDRAASKENPISSATNATPIDAPQANADKRDDASSLATSAYITEIQTGLPASPAADDAASAILTDTSDIFATEGESTARVSHANADKAEVRRQQLLQAIMAQEAPSEPEPISEASQLINLRHYTEMARADKRQKNKRLAIIVALVGAVIGVAAYFASISDGSGDDDDNNIPTITSASRAFDSISGQTISDADIEKMIPADDFEIFDVHADETPRVQKPAKPKVENKNEVAVNEIYGVKTDQDGAQTPQDNSPTVQDAAAANNAQPNDEPSQPDPDESRLRRDGRAEVALQKQNFASAHPLDGSKIKKTATMQDRFKLGLSTISRSVQECHRREAKNGTMNINKLYIRFEVQPSGIVETFAIENENVPETFIKCIDSKKNRWKFMEFDGKPVSLRQGFILN